MLYTNKILFFNIFEALLFHFFATLYIGIFSDRLKGRASYYEATKR